MTIVLALLLLGLVSAFAWDVWDTKPFTPEEIARWEAQARLAARKLKRREARTIHIEVHQTPSQSHWPEYP